MNINSCKIGTNKEAKTESETSNNGATLAKLLFGDASKRNRKIRE